MSKKNNLNVNILNKIVKRAICYSTTMIHLANNRNDVSKGDPKVGGHPAASSSCAHILGALHLKVKGQFDHIAVKPHASPMDHSYSYLLRALEFKGQRPLTEEEAKKAMYNLRHFTDPEKENAEPVFQSYHSPFDPDSFNFFPSGTVGIPPVVSAYTALAYRFAKHHGFEVPENVHFWSVIGDSEFREGSLHECMPDIAERELNNVTWIIDYNRQNLDGNRIKNENGLARTDAERIEALALANGWNVIHARHGFKREQLFQEIGEELRAVFESFSDFETQALLVTQDNLALKNRCLEIEPALKKKFEKFPEDKLCQKLREAFEDFGGHDIALLIEILEKCKTSNRPSLIIAHTIKGWGIKSLAARPGNHSMLPEEDEVLELLKAEGLDFNDPFNLKFNDEKVESYLKERAKFLEEGRQKQRELKKKNESLVKQKFIDQDGLPLSFDINLKLSPYANTQWMWGQLASKLIRIATTDESKLSESEKKWKLVSAHIATLAPDVGTSTNMNPSMDSKVYAPGAEIEDYELKYNVKDTRRPNLVPLERQDHRHIRFEIEEANSMSCLGAFGKMKDHLGVYLLPFMTIYDFFIKRALDQYFYNLYWGSSFILVGTPSGVTLSPEGAQHCWKSDFQIPNQITWEPAFAIEMDWIVRDAIERHFTDNNKERTGVLIRAVTRGIEQKLFFENLKNQKRFENLSEKEILEKTKQDCLEGGYWLILHEGKEDYAPGDNVIHLFVMGALVQEACEASKKLYEEHGIYANVLVVTSPDLLLGNLGRKNNYKHLKEGLNVKGDLYLTRSKTISKGNTTEILDNIELISMKASRVPILGICDGEPGFLDNSGSIVGVQSDTLALRKHSKSGTPKDVYRYHGLDAESIANSALKLLTESCFDEVLINSKLLN